MIAVLHPLQKDRLLAIVSRDDVANVLADHRERPIAALLISHDFNKNLSVVTTWHNSEPVAEVAEFFINIAGAHERCLLIAVLESNDAELATLLVQHSSSAKDPEDPDRG